MPQRIEVPGQGVIEFPDGMTDDQIAAAIRGNPQPIKPMSSLDKIAFGAADPIHGGAQLLTHMLPSGMVNAGNRFNNWLADKTGLVANVPESGGVDQMVANRESEYQALRAASGESGFDGYRTIGNVISPVNAAAGSGLARIASRAPAMAGLGGRMAAGAGVGAASGALAPVTAGDFAEEKAKQAAAGAAAGGLAPVATGALARLINPNAANNANLALLRSEGVRPTLGQALGGWANKVEEKATSLPILGDAISAARARSLESFNNAAINRATAPIGKRIDGVGQQAVREAGNAVSKAYDDALATVKHVKFDAKFANDIGQLKAMARNLVPDMRAKFDKQLRDTLGGRTSPAGAMLGTTFKKVDSEIGHQAASFGRSSVASEQELGDALKQLQALLREQVARSNPATADALRKADAGWANLVRVEGAAKAGKNAEGVFTPAQLNMAIQAADNSVRKRAVSRGTALMQDLGSAGQAVVGNKVPNSFTTDRALIAGGGLASGAINPLIPAGLLGSSLLYTSPAQRALVWAATQRPQAAGGLAEAIRNAGLVALPGVGQVGAGLLNQ